MGIRSAMYALALAAWLAPSVYAQPTTPSSRVPNVTRLVKIFSELEARLAAKAADSATLERMLDPAFEVRDSTAPGVPVPRDEWIRQQRASPSQAPRIDQMAVHDFGDIALVSFRQVD